MEPKRSYLADMTQTTVHTAEDLLRFKEPGKTAELVRGLLIVREPPETGHGARSARLTVRIGAFVEEHDLGEIFAQDTGFKIERDPDTVRAPDLAFVARDRLAEIPEKRRPRSRPTARWESPRRAPRKRRRARPRPRRRWDPAAARADTA